MQKLLMIIVLAFVTESPSAGAASAESATNPVVTQVVWQHHIDAWGKRDLNEIVTDYNNDSILIINGKIFRGRNEIKKIFRRLFEIFDSGSNEIDPPVLDGRTVFLTWHFTPHGSGIFDGTDTFVIEEGVIRIQTIASLLYEKFPIDSH